MEQKTTTMKSASADGRHHRRWLWLGMWMVVLGTWAAGVWAQTVAPATESGRGAAMAPGAEHGMHRGGHHGMGGAMGAGMMMRGSPERVARGVDRMLDGLDASEAQRSQIKQIAQAAAADLKAQQEARRALRERGLQVFTAPTVDAQAAESLRLQMLTQHDQASRRITLAMLDIARVLTPEQRAKLGERIRDQSARMRDRMERMQREKPHR